MSFAVSAGCVVVEWLCSRLPDISRSVVQVCLELLFLDHRLSRFPGYPRAPESKERIFIVFPGYIPGSSR